MTLSQKGGKQKSKPLGLSKGLKQLYQHQLLCDSTVVCEGKRFSCHRAVLAAVSPYFHDVFTSSQKESPSGEVLLQDIAPSLFQSILKYIYTEEVSLTEETAQDLFEAADKLKILPLVDICYRFFRKNISPQNCFVLYRLAQAYSDEALLQAAVRFVILNFSRFCEGDDFLYLDLTSLITILSSGDLAAASELDVFRAAQRWVRAHPGTYHFLVNALMSHVRLPLLTDGELAEVQAYLGQVGDVQLQCKQLDGEERLRASGGLRAGMYDECIMCINTQILETQAPDTEDSFMDCYDPCTRTWRKLPGLKSLTHPACVALGDRLFVSGGICRNSYSDALYEFSSLKGSWAQLPSMLVPRATHGFLVCDQRLYAMGGWCGFHEFLSSAECFDIAEGTWTPISRMPYVLSRCAAAAFRKKLYLLGGVTGLTSYWQFHKGLLIYDVSEDAWTQVLLDAAFFSAGAVAMNNGIYVVGGYTEKRAGERIYEGGLMPENRYCSRKCFFLAEDGSVNHEIAVPKLPKGIAYAGVVSWGKRIYVLGGEDTTHCYKTIYYWEPGEHRWSRCPDDIPVPEGVSGFGCTTLKIPKERVLSLLQQTSVALTAVVGK
ncbi:PREDICTED: kelch-like protein 6 [Crocodylus porosus]|uniref:kelch-like protein 6 n=1 Tax=Crocodylus porosus TaxID=8502 RepID=UPI00093BCDE9|nr:PREDICTED: kelch-like protein 6 [Crocodylus porosus]